MSIARVINQMECAAIINRGLWLKSSFGQAHEANLLT
jgi:hypothetical protein